MEKHGFAVIGIKGVGGTHIKGIQSLPNAQLVALVDIDEAAVTARAAEVGARAFTHYEEMLRLPEVEIVNIATPHPLHPEMAREAERMVEVSQRTGRKLGVNYQSRVSARNRTIREIIRNELGELYRMTSVSGGVRTQAYYDSGAWRATWDQEGGGVLVNQAPLS
jgi:UDP-N-acetyl-2-amino-2-deoxyglucuronate dehydrogenase